MLFNSFAFIFVFLPVCCAAYFIAARIGPRSQVAVLAAASIAFYCGWDIRYLPLLLTSIIFNYIVGRQIVGPRRSRCSTKTILAIGVSGNLLILGYYKYANFFIDIADGLGASLPAMNVILPLGISFFTFTQLAFLVDAHRGKTDEPKFLEYLTFVTYFPHLIAGPIIHHHETIPQFRRPNPISASWLAPGIALFSIGLAKKVIIADTFGSVARPVFDGFSRHPDSLTGLDAWVGALCYTFQLYFDFSAYSDMAIGLSLMLGIYIPLNFNSPYRAISIIDFWRRWHMTLSRYLRDYLYIPLGGNRYGPMRRHLNLLITMLLGGLWHGAGWTFVVWGGLHGIYLIINHTWRSAVGEGRLGVWPARLLTFLCVVVAWVFFRSETMPSALAMLSSMVSASAELSPAVAEALSKTVVPPSILDAGLAIPATVLALLLIVSGLVMVWAFPNSQEIVFSYQHWWTYPLNEAPTPAGWIAATWLAPMAGLCFVVAVLGLIAAPPGEFLYFNF